MHGKLDIVIDMHVYMYTYIKEQAKSDLKITFRHFIFSFMFYLKKSQLKF